MQDPVADMLMLDEIENLGLVDIAGVGPRMEDAVRIEGELGWSVHIPAYREKVDVAI